MTAAPGRPLESRRLPGSGLLEHMWSLAHGRICHFQPCDQQEHLEGPHPGADICWPWEGSFDIKKTPSQIPFFAQSPTSIPRQEQSLWGHPALTTFRTLQGPRWSWASFKVSCVSTAPAGTCACGLLNRGPAATHREWAVHSVHPVRHLH